jgi:hypothetical protein
MFCIVTVSFPGSLLAAAAACCRVGFRVKLDTLFVVVMILQETSYYFVIRVLILTLQQHILSCICIC